MTSAAAEPILPEAIRKTTSGQFNWTPFTAAPLWSSVGDEQRASVCLGRLECESDVLPAR